MTAWGFLLLQWAKFNWILAKVRSKVRRSFPQRKAVCAVLFSSFKIIHNPVLTKKMFLLLHLRQPAAVSLPSSSSSVVSGVRCSSRCRNLKGADSFLGWKLFRLELFNADFSHLILDSLSDWSLLTCFGKKKTWAVSLPFPTIYFSLMHTWFRRANIFCLILSDSAGAHTQ